jgi:hypothetical protein
MQARHERPARRLKAAGEQTPRTARAPCPRGQRPPKAWGVCTAIWVLEGAEISAGDRSLRPSYFWRLGKTRAFGREADLVRSIASKESVLHREAEREDEGDDDDYEPARYPVFCVHSLTLGSRKSVAQRTEEKPK